MGEDILQTSATSSPLLKFNNMYPRIPQIDHKEYPKRLRHMSDATLLYIIRDCQEAIKSLPDNPKNGYYADEINYCANELSRRRNGRK